ncbi:MAG: Lrp/AsnC ligand binding domain-containing protein [Candidatus Bathyarchaeota archaeon]|nr:Lrp/AsnC ligand binding domain-containing protein [Candidatus Termiticorpusculum sp.]
METDFSREIFLDTGLEKIKPQRHAYVFINTETEAYDSAIDDIRRIEGVSEVYPSKGAYDIVAKVSGESIDYLKEQIFTRIKNLSNIKSTLTLMVIDQ